MDCRPRLTFRPLTAALTAVLLLASAGVALAQPFTWQVPAGGETWTAGTSHVVEWSGGPSGPVDVSVIRVSPFVTADVIAVGTANDGYAQWNIPANLLPGAYLLYVEDSPLSTYAYSASFTVQSGPACAPGCVLTSASIPYFEPPGAICGSTAAAAQTNAQSYILGQLSASCVGGTTLDPASVMIDITPLPVAVCLSGYGGAFTVDVSAVGCCCPDATPSLRSTWGKLKTLYR